MVEIDNTLDIKRSSKFLRYATGISQKLPERRTNSEKVEEHRSTIPVSVATTGKGRGSEAKGQEGGACRPYRCGRQTKACE